MHKTKLEYLQKMHLHPEEDCFSALITVVLDSMIIGTPAIASLKPFSKMAKKAPATVSFARAVRMSPLEEADSGENTPRYRDPYKKVAYAKPKEDSIEKISVKDLYGMGIAEANELLQNSGINANVIFPFSFYEDSKDFYVYRLRANQLYFDGKKPLIFDEGHILELGRLADAHDKDDLQNFVEVVNDSLRSNRYLNYVFSGVALSNIKYMLEDINTIFNSLKKAYPKNVSFYRYPTKAMRCLVDTVSVSFYRIEDVIAIFDFKKMSGIVVEIFLTNSNHKIPDMDRSGSTATYRFLFSKSRENIFSIDGESIKRQYDKNTTDVLSLMSSTISKNIPNDEKLEQKKSKTTSI
jgi:hypothetical protein